MPNIVQMLGLLTGSFLFFTACGVRSATEISDADAVQIDLQDAAQMFGGPSAWLTFTIEERSGTVSKLASKRWSTHVAANGVVSLVEAAYTSFQLATDAEKLVPAKIHATLPDGLKLSTFSMVPNPEELDIPCTRIFLLPNGKLRLEFADSGVFVVATPAAPFSGSENFTVDSDEDTRIGVWTAPLGIAVDAILPAFQIFGIEIELPKAEYFMHLSSTQQAIVTIDETFPVLYLPQLESAIAKWNAAIGGERLVLDAQPKKTAIEDCISERKICLRWSGSDVFAWTGFSGSGVSSFDPASGEIMGGIVQIGNAADTDNLGQAPAAIDALINEDKMDIESAADIFLRREEFAQLRRPKPELLVEWLLLHEIGHTLGLSHDFLGSIAGNSVTPSETVMDYPPFPLAHKLSNLGDKDLGKVDRVYRDGKQSPEKIAANVCSDMASIPVRIDGFMRKVASRCNQYDVGTPSSWYLALSRLGANGFLTQVPFPFQIPLPFHSPEDNSLAMHLGYALKDDSVDGDEKAQISAELCAASSQGEIIALLKRRLDLDLICPGSP